MSKKEETAFSKLVEAYQVPVYDLCYHMLGDEAAAEEAAQETFCQAYRRRDSLDSDQPPLKWLLSIACRHCIRTLRRKTGPEVNLNPLSQSGQNGEPAKAQKLLEKFPPERRAAIILRCCYGFTEEEIARITAEDRQPAASRLQQAGKVQLRNILSSASRLFQTTASAPSLH